VVPAPVKLPAVAAFELGSCLVPMPVPSSPTRRGAVGRPDPYGGRASRASPRERTRQAQTKAIRESDHRELALTRPWLYEAPGGLQNGTSVIQAPGCALRRLDRAYGQEVYFPDAGWKCELFFIGTEAPV
jgi:hypothetical protein